MRKIELLDSSSLTDTLIIKARDVDAFLSAASTVQEAQKWAEAYKQDVQAQIKQMELDAISKGYAEGLRQFREAVDAYDAARAGLVGQVMDLLTKCLFRVFREYPARAVLEKTLLPIINNTAPTDDLLIAVNPGDADDLNAVLIGHEKDMGIQRSFSIECRDEMDPGECIIYSSSEVFHFSISVLINQLTEAISNIKDRPEPGSKENDPVKVQHE